MKKIALFLLLTFFFGCQRDQKKNNTQIKKQNIRNIEYTTESNEFKKSYTWKFQRKVQSLELVKAVDLNIKCEEILANNKTLILSDFTHSQLVFLNSNYKITKKFGKKGDAPDEINKLYYFSVFNDTIILHDFGQRRHKRFVKDEYIDDERIGGSSSYSGKFLSPTLFYEVVNNEKKKHLLYKRFKEKKSITDYLLKDLFKLSDDKIINSVGVENSIVVNKLLAGQFSVSKSTSNNIYYLSNAGYFANFDNSGNLKYVKQTIDNTPFPFGTMKDLGNGIKIPKVFPYANIFLSGTNNDKHFYLLNIINRKKNNNLTYSVDYYNVIDGSYAGSFDIPYYKEQAPQVIAVTPDDKYLYVYYEDLALCKYEIH